MTDILDTTYLSLQTAYTLGIFALFTALFWHMRRIGKPGLAETLWWLMFAFFAIPLAASLYAVPSALVLIDAWPDLTAMLILIVARWFNPLQPREEWED